MLALRSSRRTRISEQCSSWTSTRERFIELVRNKDLVRAKDEEVAWAVTKRLPQTLDKTDSTTVVNYQIVASSVGVRYTFLVHINTGATWKLSAAPDKEQSYWYPIKSQ